MRVEVGPLPSASALAWIRYANDVLVERAGHELGPDVVDGFRRYLDDWRAVAEASPEFHWVATIPTDLGEYLIHAFYRLARQLSEERGSSPSAPPESAAFYILLVQALLDALADEGGSGSEFADHLRSFWPGLEDV